MHAPAVKRMRLRIAVFRVSEAKRLMLSAPGLLPTPQTLYSLAPTKAKRPSSATSQWTHNNTTAADVVHGGGVDRRHAALARCLADVILSHSGAKVFIDQAVPALTRVRQPDRVSMHAWTSSSTSTDQSHIWMSPLLLLSLAIRFWSQQTSTRPGFTAKSAEKGKFDRYPRINLVPFILETTGRPWSTRQKIISYLMRDAGNPPLAIRDTWSAVQSVLHSAISKQQLSSRRPLPHPVPFLRRPRYVKS